MKTILLFFLLTISFQFVVAQEYSITHNFQNLLFGQFVDSVEKQIPVKIYYDKKQTDSLMVDIHAKNMELTDLLDEILADSAFSFHITHDNQVIVFKGEPIKADFYAQFLVQIEQKNKKISAETETKSSTIVEDENIDKEYHVFQLGSSAELNNGKTAVISGYITDGVTGVPIYGATIYNNKLKLGSVSNAEGYYTLRLPKGQHQLEYRLIGMKPTRRNVLLFSDGRLSVKLYEKHNVVEEVTVLADKGNKVRSSDMGIEKMSLKMLKQLPMAMGEADVIKSTLLLPGVQTVGEAASGYNVRGGSNDQNLILLDGAPIINPNHFFGFFSSFNSDLIESVNLYKSGVPNKYGGRVSSVLEINLIEGNKQRTKVSGGINPMAGRILVQGPVGKKISYAISTRKTYSDWLLNVIPNKQIQHSSASFDDIQGIVHLNPSDKSKISLSGYHSNDKFDYYRQSAYDYNNNAASLKWQYQLNPKLLALFSATYSNYNYMLDTKTDTTSFNSLYYNLNQYILKADFNNFSYEKHKINFGADLNAYNLMPGKQSPLGTKSEISDDILDTENAVHGALYLGDEYEINPLLVISAGVRYNIYMSLNSGTEYNYYSDLPRTLNSIVDTIFYNGLQVSSFHHAPELRLTSRLQLGLQSSVKFGLQRMYQYIHVLSNTMAMSPTDTWKLSNKYIKPQRSDQISIGYYQNMRRNTIESSLEVYYKQLDNIIDYKGGALLSMNHHIETDILNGVGKAYGVELMIKKTKGDLSGWISYTYSRVFHKIESQFEVESINSGNYFSANYDKPHDLKLVANYQLSRRFNITSNFIYNTGRPVTYPVAYYNFANTNRIFYSNRNQYRIPDYMRLDIAATLNGNLRRKKLNHSSFTLAIYNALGRNNPYSVFFRSENGTVNGYQLSIFSRPVITLTYNFKIFGNASDDF